MGQKKGYDKKFDSAYISTEASRFQHLPNPNYLTSAGPDDQLEPEDTMTAAIDAYMEQGIDDTGFGDWLDTDTADAGFDDWLDEDNDEEEDLPLQAETAAFPEIPVRQPGPSTSQARKGTKIGDDDDPVLCKKCLGSFKRRTHKKKIAKNTRDFPT